MKGISANFNMEDYLIYETRLRPNIMLKNSATPDKRELKISEIKCWMTDRNTKTDYDSSNASMRQLRIVGIVTN